MEDSGILVLQTGGTIDKDYPKRSGGYAFEICSCAAARILQRAQASFPYAVKTICQVDSQDITDKYRQDLVHECQSASQKRILITHGTDTMIQTARYLETRICNKIIILVGAFKPETFKNSDADFNVGFALGSLMSIPDNGVYVAMNGTVQQAHLLQRDEETGNFLVKLILSSQVDNCQQNTN